MTAPDKYAEKAMGLARDAAAAKEAGDFLDDAAKPIAAALREAEAEGMRRAAEIAFTRRLPVTEAADGSIQRMLRAFGNEVRGVVVDDIRKAILSQAGGE